MQHLAMIMDGNRRWAKKNRILNPYGKPSQESVKTAIGFCIKNKIEHLSLFAFSLENFDNRSALERNRVFSLLKSVLIKKIDELIKQGVCIRFIGDRRVFPNSIMPAIVNAENKTQHCDVVNLNILFCYGAKQEIANAIKVLAERVRKGELDINDINDEKIRSVLWTAGIPDPDLIIRTSGVSRLSNFLLYQAAYSEFASLDCYWPEITEAHLQQCMTDYRAVKQNFGS
jgi:undecaprenyl diphosphate synthase